MLGRVLLLIAAFVVAGLGALLVFLYAQQADDRAIAQLDPTSVLVLIQPVAAGTSVTAAQEAGSFELRDRPANAVPPTALADLEQNQEDVVLTDLMVGEILLSDRLGDPTELERLPIPDGQIATSFTFGDPNRVADFIAPGSSVAVFLTRTPEETETVDPETGEIATAAGTPSTRLLLPEAQVIAVGNTTTVTETVTTTDGEQQTTEVNRALLTLALTQQQAEQLILGQNLGELYLGLLTDTSVIEPDEGTNVGNVFEVAVP